QQPGQDAKPARSPIGSAAGKPSPRIAQDSRSQVKAGCPGKTDRRFLRLILRADPVNLKKVHLSVVTFPAALPVLFLLAQIILLPKQVPPAKQPLLTEVYQDFRDAKALLPFLKLQTPKIDRSFFY